jgi:UDP-N-acetylmuramoyl-tripeptide--D-alanyl-D-alanine ligase
VTAFVWTDHQVRAALGLTPTAGDPSVTYRAVSTDSRSVGQGDLFVALEGDRFDGHDYIGQAVAQGAAGAVVSRPVDAGGARCYEVDGTLRALGLLARHRRRSLSARVVGITGSAGKTTAKDLTRGALSRELRVHATRGNLNNQIGVPLTLLAAPEDAEVVVVEMGTNEPGEIGILTAIAEPEVGVVTTVGETHLEKLGSFAGVLAEKLDLLRGLPATGSAVVGDEPPELADAARAIVPGVRVAGWTDRADADLRPADPRVDDQGRYRFRWHGEEASLSLPGRHAVVNALLALAVADLVGVSAVAAVSGVSGVTAGSLRGEIRRLGGLTVLVDCYNANPQSVRAALDLLEALPAAEGRVAVLGSMLELGDRSDALHDELLADALSRRFELVVATGAFADATERSADASRGLRDGRLVVSRPVEGAYDAMSGRLRAGAAVLLKGSRGVRLERLLEPLERDFGTGAEEVA